MGYTVTVKLPKELSDDDIVAHNHLAHWLNQNTVVRLFAILDAFGFIHWHHKNTGYPTKPIGEGQFEACSPDKWDEIHVIIALRHQIAHEMGNYDRSDELKRHIQRSLARLFGGKVDRSLVSSEFALPIDRVVLPMIEASKSYIKTLQVQTLNR